MQEKKDRVENIIDLPEIIAEKAKDFGVDLIGFVNLEDIQRSPSYQVTREIGYFGDGDKDNERTVRRNHMQWPEGSKSAIVIAMQHPGKEPELDWWVTKSGSLGNTEGNRLLMRTMSKLAEWLETEMGIRCFKIPYNVEHGGVFMKDAAMLSGLGCIGKNNILVTPEYGPRVRLRVMLIEADVPSTGVLNFDPCGDCTEPCRNVCPQDAFAELVYSANDFGIAELPGRNGVYNRLRCNKQMKKNESDAEVVVADGHEANNIELVKYCRRCELVCPVGSGK